MRPHRFLAVALAAGALLVAAPGASAQTQLFCNYDSVSFNACLHFTVSYSWWSGHAGLDLKMPPGYAQEVMACGPNFKAELWGDEQWQVLVQEIEKRNPQSIAINTSRVFAFLQVVGVALEVRVVIDVLFAGVVLIERDAAGLAHEKAGHGAVFDGEYRRIAGREDVDRLVRARVAAAIVEGVLQL